MSNNTNLEDIKKSVVLNANVETVWDAVATSKGIAAWWMNNDFVPSVGEAFTLYTEGYGESPCKVTNIIPNEEVRFIWGKDWTASFKLRKIDGHTTEFTLIHSGWDDEKETEFGQPHSEVRGFMDQGWDKIINESLVSYVEKQG
ncbi:SRPBCC domain-containing protein [Mammaliicoccus sp. Dog046]|uniref:SRPBCC family protein n=1 Tax=Mammaliicoccus sp. Dog046 TaxID=3034233 RepID=UPI002B26356C|nr:SRPBCC domain-containing protein [Mammaliicoccus sp. Dog046]WQK85767.1 SRPBCC domain-containing protein [Mammaliicoccus sp. Dog046]